MTIAHNFHLAIFPTTQRQWQEYMGSRPWRDHPEFRESYEGEDFPAMAVTYGAATEFAQRFSHRHKVDALLPSDAEWEYALRAGEIGEYPWGDDFELARHYAQLDYDSKFSDNVPGKVGSLRPNAWGLYDMAGNVRELVRDRCNAQSGSPYLKKGHFKRTVDFESTCGEWCITRNTAFCEADGNVYCGRRKLIPIEQCDIGVGCRLMIRNLTQ